MDVGIIGLKPRQAAQLESLNFNVGIALYPHETYDQVRVSAFCRAHENIILLSGHVPRRLMTDTPSARTKLIPGNVGISSVITHLEQTYGYKETVAEASDSQDDSASDNAAETPAPAKKVGGLSGWQFSLVTGHAVRYDPDQTDNVSIERPGAGGRFSYAHLAALAPGDLLRYPRAPGETGSAAYQRFQYLRKAQLQNLVADIEIHVFEDYVDLYVGPAKVKMAEAESWKRISKQRVLIDMMSVGHRLNARDVERAAEVSMQAAAVMDVVENTSSETAVETESVAVKPQTPTPSGIVEIPAVWRGGMARVAEIDTPAEAPVTPVTARLSAEERAFWERVYVAAMTAGADPERAQQYAAQAVEHFKSI